MNMTMEARQAAMVTAAEKADPGKQIPTLAQIAAMQDVALSIWQDTYNDNHRGGGQAYMKFEQLREYFGFSKERMNSYLRGFKARGVNIRMIQPTDENGALGKVSYNVADIEKAMLVVSDEQSKH